MAPAWSSIIDRCGSLALKFRVRELLMHLTKQELPHVKSDVELRLHQRRDQQETMGLPRSDANSQRLYLVKIATNFLSMTQAALNGYYTGKIFKGRPDLKLITNIMKLNEVFSDSLWKRGHKQHFGPSWNDEGENIFGGNIGYALPAITLSDYPELDAINLSGDYECPKPLKGPIMGHIEDVFESSRGPELGTVRATTCV